MHKEARECRFPINPSNTTIHLHRPTVRQTGVVYRTTGLRGGNNLKRPKHSTSLPARGVTVIICWPLATRWHIHAKVLRCVNEMSCVNLISLSYHEQSVVLPVFVQEQRGPVLLVLKRVADVLGVLQSDLVRNGLILILMQLYLWIYGY